MQYVLRLIRVVYAKAAACMVGHVVGTSLHRRNIHIPTEPDFLTCISEYLCPQGCDSSAKESSRVGDMEPNLLVLAKLLLSLQLGSTSLAT